MLLTPHPTPIQEIHDPLLKRHGVRLLLKRADLVHPVISGNKWYKLKYNLLEARQQGVSTLLSFGGAYSNHIHALAGVGSEYGFKTIGVIRGEAHEPLNPTLRFAVAQGMVLHYLSRADYRLKQTPQLIEQLRQRFGDFYLIPEGGTNALAVQGCSEMLADVREGFDVVVCACGTGGTLAGLIAGLDGERRVLGIAVLKGAEFLRDEVRRLLEEHAQLSDWHNHPPLWQRGARGDLLHYPSAANPLQSPFAKGGDGGIEAAEQDRSVLAGWQIECGYHHGGYAKTTAELLAFMARFDAAHGVKLDPVYTGKLMFALYDMIEQQRFARGTTLLAIHTGGVQGRAGFGLN